jgi:mRNA interferase MazF
MARFVSGDVVVVPFPFTDLASAKVRPAVVLSSLTRGDVILCQITSQAIRLRFMVTAFTVRSACPDRTS